MNCAKCSGKIFFLANPISLSVQRKITVQDEEHCYICLKLFKDGRWVSFMSHPGTEMSGVSKKKKIHKISVGNFRSERSQVSFVHRPFSITMDTSKRTYELPMTFPDRVVGLIYSLSNHKSSLTNLVEANGKSRKPQQLSTHYFTRPFIFSPAFLWLHARRTKRKRDYSKFKF